MGEKKEKIHQKTDSTTKKDNKNVDGLRCNESYKKEEMNLYESDDYEENLEGTERNVKKKRIVVSIIVTLLIGLATVLWFKGYDIVNYAFTVAAEIAEEDNNEKKDTNIDTNEDIKESNIVLSEEELLNIYDRVHQLANTIIIPEDGLIWGEEEITKKAIEEVLVKLKGNDDELYSELSKWLELDLDNAVDVHNYVWSKLGGSEGRASAINEEAITKVIKVLSD